MKLIGIRKANEEEKRFIKDWIWFWFPCRVISTVWISFLFSRSLSHSPAKSHRDLSFVCSQILVLITDPLFYLHFDVRKFVILAPGKVFVHLDRDLLGFLFIFIFFRFRFSLDLNLLEFWLFECVEIVSMLIV